MPGSSKIYSIFNAKHCLNSFYNTYILQIFTYRKKGAGIITWTSPMSKVGVQWAKPLEAPGVYMIFNLMQNTSKICCIWTHSSYIFLPIALDKKVCGGNNCMGHPLVYKWRESPPLPLKHFLTSEMFLKCEVKTLLTFQLQNGFHTLNNWNSFHTCT